MDIGKRYKTNSSGELEIVEYINASKVRVRFEDGYERFARAGCIRRGEVINPFTPSFFGEGYIGAIRGSGGYSVKSREGMFWMGMLERCYSERSLARKPKYRGCKVQEEWKNLQIFGDWCQDQIGFNKKGWQLDKDILTGSKRGFEYSEQYSVFIPREINTLFIVPREDGDSKLPMGVSYDKSRGKYQVGVGAGGVRKDLGRFDTVEEAFETYKIHKIRRVKELIDKYYKEVDERVIQSLEDFCRGGVEVWADGH